MVQAASEKDAGERRGCREQADPQALILSVGNNRLSDAEQAEWAARRAVRSSGYLSLRSKVTSLRESKELMVLTALLALPRSAQTS